MTNIIILKARQTGVSTLQKRFIFKMKQDGFIKKCPNCRHPIIRIKKDLGNRKYRLYCCNCKRSFTTQILEDGIDLCKECSGTGWHGGMLFSGVCNSCQSTGLVTWTTKIIRGLK